MPTERKPPPSWYTQHFTIFFKRHKGPHYLLVLVFTVPQQALTIKQSHETHQSTNINVNKTYKNIQKHPQTCNSWNTKTHKDIWLAKKLAQDNPSDQNNWIWKTRIVYQQLKYELDIFINFHDISVTIMHPNMNISATTLHPNIKISATTLNPNMNIQRWWMPFSHITSHITCQKEKHKTLKTHDHRICTVTTRPNQVIMQDLASPFEIFL